jgi:ADP-ribose pyrophosphatase
VPFRRIEEKTVYSGHVEIGVVTVEAPDGTTFEREITHPGDAVAVVALHPDGQVTLVRQYRAAVDAEILELPAGKLDVDGEPPLECARRELVEEVGLSASTWELLVTFVNSPGSADQRTTVYLATDLERVPDDRQGVEEQAMTVERLPLADAVDLVRTGGITDAKTVIGLLLTVLQARATGNR